MSKPHIDYPDDAILVSEVTDEALERACSPCDGAAATLVGTYCLTCPAETYLGATFPVRRGAGFVPDTP
jgi:hypothetical protein